MVSISCFRNKIYTVQRIDIPSSKKNLLSPPHHFMIPISILAFQKYRIFATREISDPRLAKWTERWIVLR
ncbi:MAG: hypothetical protein QXU18_07785 [Thermoplasmatales archaeon]